MPDLLELTTDLVRAQIHQENIDHASLDNWLRRTHANLLALWQNELGTPAEQPAPSEPIDWRRSIRQKHIVCLECGEASRQLNPRHLKEHGLDAASYRSKYGMPPRQPLSARESTRRRREVAAAVRPWERARANRGRKSRGE